MGQMVCARAQGLNGAPVVEYASTTPTHSCSYLWPHLEAILGTTEGRRIFEIGCGNGATAKFLSDRGYDVIGVDPSESGIRIANMPNLHAGSAYDDLSATYGRFPIVISLEVIEHLMEPRRFVQTARNLLEPNGLLILSTPFHGYWKNLALALSGKMDDHFTALWDGGHIKFWSERTLGTLLREGGFQRARFLRAGRIRPLAKSMIAVAYAP